MPIIIGIAGKLGVGKNWYSEQVVGDLLQQLDKKWIPMAFANQLKINTIVKNGISFDSVFHEKTKSSRELLQKEGVLAREISPSVWLDYLNCWIKVYESAGFDHVILTDVRFKNELEYVKSRNGIVVKIVAPKRNESRLMAETLGDTDAMKKISSNISECDLDEIPDNQFDIVISNDPGELEKAQAQKQFASVYPEFEDRKTPHLSEAVYGFFGMSILLYFVFSQLVR